MFRLILVVRCKPYGCGCSDWYFLDGWLWIASAIAFVPIDVVRAKRSVDDIASKDWRLDRRPGASQIAVMMPLKLGEGFRSEDVLEVERFLADKKIPKEVARVYSPCRKVNELADACTKETCKEFVGDTGKDAENSNYITRELLR